MLRTSISIAGVFLLATCIVGGAAAQETKSNSDRYVTESNILYRESDDPMVKQMCRLDIHYPKKKTDYSTIVWFHGGGLTGGKRTLPQPLKEKGVAIITVDYRLSPKVKVTQCIDDAAAAIAVDFPEHPKIWWLGQEDLCQRTLSRRVSDQHGRIGQKVAKGPQRRR